jgi:glycosyltransferase involved in cell wall biosynthesis
MSATGSSIAGSLVAPIVGNARGLSALFLVNSLNVGGSETKTIRVVNGLLQRGVRAGIACLNEPSDLLLKLDREAPVWNLARRGKFSTAALRRLRSVIQRQKPGCVLSVNMYPALYVALATAGMRARPRTVALLNTTTLPEGEHWRRTFYRPFLRRMDRIVYGCGLQRGEWLPYLKHDQARSSVIYNGVDTDHFVPRAVEAATTRTTLGIPPKAFVVGSIGRLDPEKNQQVLIEATAQLRHRSIDAHLLLVGEGRKRSELEQQVDALNLRPHVTFTGVQSDVRPLLQAMDVFVLPSTHVETFSNAALEAMAMSRPVILSRVGGAAEMVRDNVEGYTLNVSELATELPKVLERLYADGKIRERLGRAARARVEECFSARSMIDAFATLIAADVSEPLEA